MDGEKKADSGRRDTDGVSGMNEELGALRERIDGIDGEIVRLLSRRQRVVEDVVALKKRHGLPVFHPAREEDLISRRRRQGDEMGLNPDYIEDIYRTVIRRSRVEQTGAMALKSVRPGASVLVVGGKGRMGRYFSKIFSNAGYEVRILEKEDWPRVETLCKGTDLIFLSVPIEQTCDVAGRLGPHLPEDAVFADLTSLKEAPVKAMLRAHSGPVVGLHPLFGPSTSSLDKQIIVATPGRDQEACRWVLDQFSAWGAILLTARGEEHDEIMDLVQALRHFATFVFGRFLAENRIDISRTLEFSSPIYRLELGMVGRLFAQDPGLYCEIVFASSKRRKLLKSYIASMNAHMEMIEKDDREGFQEAFKKISQWFGPFSDQAMRESTFLIDKLIERF